MVCDYLRSCYTTKARLIRDDPTEFTLRWYFADEHAETLPFVSNVTSLNWMTQPSSHQGIGEVYGAPRRWSAGERPPEALGKKFCGMSSDFRYGAKDPLDPPQPIDASGLPACCLDGPALDAGGMAIGGGASFVITPNYGGIKIGGGIPGLHVVIPVAGGGVAIGGESSVNLVVPIDGGGMAIGGHADVNLVVPVGGGGMAIGGHAGVTLTIPVAGGGVAMGGGASFNVTVPVAGGGMAMGGIAGVTVTISVAGGGVKLGGGIGASMPISVTGGGMKLGGGMTGFVFVPGGGAGASCATAATIALSSPQTSTVAVGATDWWKFAETNLTHYTVTISGVVGFFKVQTGCIEGNCASITQVINITDNGAGGFTASLTGTAFVSVQCLDFMNPVTYTITITSP